MIGYKPSLSDIIALNVETVETWVDFIAHYLIFTVHCVDSVVVFPNVILNKQLLH
jgi:hypothetical protein